MTMEAMVLYEHGGPEVLTLTSMEKPKLCARHVRIKVKAVALNHLDLWVRKGGPAFHLDYPHRLGSDISGVVDAVGDDVHQVSEGMPVVVYPGLFCGQCTFCHDGKENQCIDYRVLGEGTQGGYSDYIVVPVNNIAPKPSHLSFEEAAAGLLSFTTAWHMLVQKGQLTSGQTVLIHGAGSGVGVAAIQIAKVFGAHVIVTAGSDEKLKQASDLGADHGINYQTQNFVSEVKEMTKRQGVSIVFEHIGGETLEKSLLITKNGGCIVTCGATQSPYAKLDIRHIFFRQLSLLGSTMGTMRDFCDVLSHFSQKTMHPVIDTVIPFHDVVKAHQLLESRQVFGKVVLTF